MHPTQPINLGRDAAGMAPRAAVIVCILFIHHIHCIISLVIACVLVVLQVVTVASELRDK